MPQISTRQAANLREWESWARGVGLLVGDGERALFDEDHAIRARLQQAAEFELVEKLPDHRYGALRRIFALVLIVLTIILVFAFVEAIQAASLGSFIAAAAVVVGLDYAWLHSHLVWRRRLAARVELRRHLIGVAAHSAFEIVSARRIKTNRRASGDSAGSSFDPKAPPPAPQRYGVNEEGARALVADWMRHLGAVDTEIAPLANRDGIDAQSARYIARTKSGTESVGVSDVRDFAGVCAADRRLGLFFTSVGYAREAIEFADRTGLALFAYHPEPGRLFAANAIAQRILDEGLSG